tara:strand:+ start:158 stop:472 length:315 start_codon:yes stop_codon:yes gene_type:complete
MFNYLQRLFKRNVFKRNAEISELSIIRAHIQKKFNLKASTESQHLEKLTSLAVIETNIALLEIKGYSEDEIYETLDSKLPYAAKVASKKIKQTILSIREIQYEL